MSMHKNIPKVLFHRSKKEEMEFEVIPIQSLFSRNMKLAHPLDKAHRTDFYQLICFTEGSGNHYVDFKQYKYFGGDFLFICKGQVHSFEINMKAKGSILLFTENFLTKNMVHSDLLSFSRLFNYHLFPPVISIPENLKPGFNNIIYEIEKEYKSDETFAREEILRTLLKLLLLKTERIKKGLIPSEKNSDWILKFTRFKELVSEKFSETRDAKDYAEMMDISYNHLNRIIKSITGKTAKAFIDSFIIIEIKRHLAVSDISIKELTYMMGFDEQTNFVKYFKKHAEISPARFKKSLTE